MFIIFASSTILMLIRICVIDAYRIPQGIPQPVFHKTPTIYRGPVFVIQETINSSEPYIGHVVEGGIEMVQYAKPMQVQPPIYSPTLVTLVNDANPAGLQDDAEYFAVLVTPQTVGQVQIPLSTMITIPLSILLASVSSKIPWVMVLKRENHFNYFKNFVPISVHRPTTSYEPFPMQIPVPIRRRTKSHIDQLLPKDDRTNMQKLTERLHNVGDEDAMQDLYSALRNADENRLVREFGREFVNIIGKLLHETPPQQAIEFKTLLMSFFNNLADNISLIDVGNSTLV